MPWWKAGEKYEGCKEFVIQLAHMLVTWASWLVTYFFSQAKTWQPMSEVDAFSGQVPY
jgi:hypothetical protein